MSEYTAGGDPFLTAPHQALLASQRGISAEAFTAALAATPGVVVHDGSDYPTPQSGHAFTIWVGPDDPDDPVERMAQGDWWAIDPGA